MSQHYHYLLRKNSTVPGLDYKQVQCLQQKRLLAFVNHFVIRTADFLSTFALQCEQKLDNINQKISRLENEMALLEFKLDSVPKLRSDTPNTEPLERNNTNEDHTKSSASANSCVGNCDMTPDGKSISEGSEENLAASRQDLHQQNPGLIPFSKMVTVGVPIEAITQKLKIHGFEDIVIESFIDIHQNKK